ncbi:MAG: DUF3530 family protein [Gammaproteobacteria bacterium]|nr:DUF3530 family protein [Gammaproteobacteria bacterium]
MRFTYHALPLLVMLALPGAAAFAAQVAELEQVIADRLAERHVPGEMIWLETGGSRFLGLFLAPAGHAPRRAVILLHGLGGHPDWPDVVQPLRARLPQLGWATLSIQLPRLSPQASHGDEAELPNRALPRIAAASAYLSGRGLETIAVVGYGFGAALGARHLDNPGKGIAAFVAVSLQIPGHLVQAVNYPESLEAVTVPVLDVYASGDSATVLQQAPERELWGRKNKKRIFDRAIIPESDAGYHGRDDDLARAIAAWLDANAKQESEK